MTLDLLYLKSNSNIPAGRVSSTARKGDKWSKQAWVGDVLFLKTTESQAVFGKAAVVAIELVTYKDVIDNADHNHAAFGEKAKASDAATVLGEELTAAYGANKPEDVYTILHILPLNE